ncbi:MAG: hypothetical protein ACP5N1_01040 [Candidatus Woesearchaeota archaeon]
MKYLPGTIIRYTEKDGYKRTLYGIVTEQLNPSCVNILTELKNEPIIGLFLDPKTSTNTVTIDKILDSYRDIPYACDNGISFSEERWYLREIGRLLELVARKSK